MTAARPRLTGTRTAEISTTSGVPRSPRRLKAVARRGLGSSAVAASYSPARNRPGAYAGYRRPSSASARPNSGRPALPPRKSAGARLRGGHQVRQEALALHGQDADVRLHDRRGGDREGCGELEVEPVVRVHDAAPTEPRP